VKSDYFKSIFKEVIDHLKGHLEINPNGLFDIKIYCFVILF